MGVLNRQQLVALLMHLINWREEAFDHVCWSEVMQVRRVALLAFERVTWITTRLQGGVIRDDIALACMLGEAGGYMYRLHLLADKHAERFPRGAVKRRFLSAAV